MFERWREDILLHLFVWAGGKLWPLVSFYSPGEDKDAPVLAIHFARDETVLSRSCEDYLGRKEKTDGD